MAPTIRVCRNEALYWKKRFYWLRRVPPALKALALSSDIDQTGFGWSKLPVCTLEMGHITNKTEDSRLVTESCKKRIVQGLTEGLIAYFQ